MFRHRRQKTEIRKRPLRILLVADEKSPYLYDYYTPDKLKGVDLILAAGDLPGRYLEFLSSAANCMVFYVRGNHDDILEKNPPRGCECIDGKLVEYQGIRILGLGGSYRYREGNNMYTEKAMRGRIRKLAFSIYKKEGFDILLTHAPIRGVDDFETMSHRGFVCFDDLIRKWHPRYMIHGHIHMNYGMKVPRETRHEGTTVINAYGYHFLEYEDESENQSTP